MSSTLAPGHSSIRRLTFLLLALALGANLALPTANAATTECAPGTGGVGSALGFNYGFVEAWNCASVTYHETDEGTEITVTALGASADTTA